MSDASSLQIKEIVEQNARIEQHLKGMNKDIKQLAELIKQLKSQITLLQTNVSKTDKTIANALANIQSKKKKGKDKKKGKKK
jgi:HPt (histidine-containing phosphotransfer) domain-containing protein